MDFVQRFKQLEEKVALILKKISDGSIGGGGSIWGAITGTLGDQTDLSTALGNKVNLTTYNEFFATLVGAIFPYAGATAPTGFLLCDGSAISRTTYSALFAKIGTTYGVGNGTTTFNIPDARGRVIVGKSSDTEFATLGQVGGAKTNTLDVTQIPAHSHRMRAYSHNVDSGWLPDDTSWLGSITQAGATDRPNPPMRGNGGVMENTGSGLAHNNIQPYITINYIIKT